MKPISDPVEENKGAPEGTGRYHVPLWVYPLTVWFPIFMFLAALAAWFYIGDILPGHLSSPP